MFCIVNGLKQGADDAAQVAFDQRHAGVFHGHIGTGTHGDADLRLREGGSVIKPSPAIATTRPSAH
jgi:hypothetical protein